MERAREGGAPLTDGARGDGAEPVARQLRETIDALRRELEERERERVAAVQAAVQQATDEITQLQATIQAQRDELDDLEAARAQDRASAEQRLRDEREQLTGTIRALREQLEAASDG